MLQDFQIEIKDSITIKGVYNLNLKNMDSQKVAKIMIGYRIGTSPLFQHSYITSIRND
jgi:hypothetical protein